MLRKGLFKFYEEKIRVDFDINIEKLLDYKLELAPIIYISILNKKISNTPREIVESKEFIVPAKYSEAWGKICSLIKSGQDISHFMSKDVIDWRKADYLLFSCNVSHMHFTSKKGRGTNNELIFGVMTKDTFYALFVGGHNDLYKPGELINIAEKNWPDTLFNLAEKKEGNYYTKRLANNPNEQFNLATPGGMLSGHQHTNLVNLNEYGIKNVPLKYVIAYNNEVDYLNEIEECFASKYGADVNLKLSVDLGNKRYKIKLGKSFSIPTYKPFLNAISCSSIAAEHGL